MILRGYAKEGYQGISDILNVKELLHIFKKMSPDVYENDKEDDYDNYFAKCTVLQAHIRYTNTRSLSIPNLGRKQYEGDADA